MWISPKDPVASYSTGRISSTRSGRMLRDEINLTTCRGWVDYDEKTTKLGGEEGEDLNRTKSPEIQDTKKSPWNSQITTPSLSQNPEAEMYGLGPRLPNPGKGEKNVNPGEFKGNLQQCGRFGGSVPVQVKVSPTPLPLLVVSRESCVQTKCLKCTLLRQGCDLSAS